MSRCSMLSLVAFCCFCLLCLVMKSRVGGTAYLLLLFIVSLVGVTGYKVKHRLLKWLFVGYPSHYVVYDVLFAVTAYGISES